MTERGRSALSRTSSHFCVGPSSLSWTGGGLEIEFDERGFPWPQRIRGRVRVHPEGLSLFEAPLDAAGLHRWGPIAPCARIEVLMSDGAGRWSGHGYLDSNFGQEPIARPFERWDWSRGRLNDGHCAVLYDIQPKMGPHRLIARRFSPDGSSQALEMPNRHELPRTAWGIRRSTRSDGDTVPFVTQVLENTPFYVRDMIRTSVGGEPIDCVHESLDARRLDSWAVRMMLPFRMPRRP